MNFMPCHFDVQNHPAKNNSLKCAHLGWGIVIPYMIYMICFIYYRYIFMLVLNLLLASGSSA